MSRVVESTPRTFETSSTAPKLRFNFWIVLVGAALFLLLAMAVIQWMQANASQVWSHIAPFVIGAGIVMVATGLAIIGWRVYTTVTTYKRHDSLLAQDSAIKKELRLSLQQARIDRANIKIAYGEDNTFKAVEIVYPKAAPTLTIEEIREELEMLRSGQAPQINAPLVLPGPMKMVDAIRTWDLNENNLLLGFGKGMEPLACSLEGFMHVAHDAPTGGGKTSQFYAEIGMLLKLGVRTILANPHFAPVSKKGDDWRPFARAIEAQGPIEVAPGVAIPGLVRKISNIVTLLQWLARDGGEIDRRFELQAQGIYTYEPIYLFIDEWPAVVKAYPEAGEYMGSVLQRGRAVEVCVDTNSQGFLKEDVDLKGSARENFNTAYHMGGNVVSGAKLLDMPQKDLNQIVKEHNLGRGVAMIRNNQGVPQAKIARLPHADNDYAYYLFGRADDWQLPEFRRSRPEMYRSASDMHALPTTPLAVIDPVGKRHDTRYREHDDMHFSTVSTGDLLNNVDEPGERLPETFQTVEGLLGPLKSEKSEKSKEYRLTEPEKSVLINLYNEFGSIDKCLRIMKRGSFYQKDASQVLKDAGLLK